MSKRSARSVIRLKGVRHNNLKNFDLDLPLNRLIVVTGLSGSGKSSLAFDTLFAEGQRRYIETFSPYARQFLDRMDKPQVDSIEGIPPAIAIEQRNSVRTTRSTVGTMTEICDYMKLLWPHVSQLHCRQCGKPVRKDSPQQIWESLAVASKLATESAKPNNAQPEFLITFEIPLSEKLSLDESLALVAKQGYQRLLVAGKVLRLDEAAAQFIQGGPKKSKQKTLGSLTVVQDRVRLNAGARPRFIEACEQAYHFGKGKLSLYRVGQAGAGGGTRSKPAERESEDVSHFRSAAALSKESPSARPSPEGEGGTDSASPNKREPGFADRRPNLPPLLLGEGRGEGDSAAKMTQPLIAGDRMSNEGKSTETGDETSPLLRFSNRLHCAQCDIEYREPSTALFSFNHPVGACPTCRGFGRTISIDYNLALPDRTKTLAQGVVKPWQSGMSAECQRDLLRTCRQLGVPTDVPFEKLARKWQDLVIDGEPDYGKDEEHEWPRAWYGIKGYFRWLESKAYKMHVRVLLSRYRAYTPCLVCGGKRFQPESLLYRINLPDPQRNSGGSDSPSGPEVGNGVEPGSFTLADFYQLPIRRALQLIEGLERMRKLPANDPVKLVLTEVRSRLAYLNEVGLGYLTLDRPTRSLSGGETERVSLTTCLGTRLVNTLFVLDEPSVGLHPRDTERLIKVLEQLRDGGNTVLVVEHEASVMRAADQIIDLGPGHGSTGGQVVFQGSFAEVQRCPSSLTGQYLSGRKRIPLPTRRPVKKRLAQVAGSRMPASPEEAFVLNEVSPPFRVGEASHPTLKLTGATLHNLRNLSVEIPLNRFVCVTGVSGSGKTTLIREVLLPALNERLQSAGRDTPDTPSPIQREPSDNDDDSALRTPHSALLSGWQHLARVVLVDQSILSKTPRSNPAVYIGAFDEIRELYAQCDLAKRRGLNASAFSFNSAQGQCERCRGAGFEKIEMQFLSDVYIRCPDCDGRRYRSHILEVKLAPPPADRGKRNLCQEPAALSIADLLDATVDEAILFLEGFRDSRPAQRALEGLKLLQETGLGYLKLGQPINTLSGGESQRLKLVKHLAESLPPNPVSAAKREVLPTNSSAPRQIGESRGSGIDSPALFLFDEPTTGLHFDDVRVLLKVFQRLVDAGHSVVVIEHNLDVIKCADWIIDLGPEAGDLGGNIVALGTPEEVAASSQSFTGQALQELLYGGRLGGRKTPAMPSVPEEEIQPPEPESRAGVSRNHLRPGT